MKVFRTASSVATLLAVGLVASSLAGFPGYGCGGGDAADAGGTSGTDGGQTGGEDTGGAGGGDTGGTSGGDGGGTGGDAGGTGDAGDLDGGTTDAGGGEDGGGGTDTGMTCAPNCPASNMVTVPAGSFEMGCNEAVDTDCVLSEKPYHSVNVPEFRIDKYEVTQGEYNNCADSGGCAVADTTGACNHYGDNVPVNCIDWNHAKAYCAWAGKRLPTEAEWEKAARGTDGRKYPWGNSPPASCENAVISENKAGCGTGGANPVGSKPAGASPYGAEDMIGNVSEWVEDDWDSENADYTRAPADGSAWMDNPRGSRRVMRGGSWYDFKIQVLRASGREFKDLTTKDPTIGFRCAASDTDADAGTPDAGNPDTDAGGGDAGTACPVSDADVESAFTKAAGTYPMKASSFGGDPDPANTFTVGQTYDVTISAGTRSITFKTNGADVTLAWDCEDDFIRVSTATKVVIEMKNTSDKSSCQIGWEGTLAAANYGLPGNKSGYSFTP